LVKETTDLNRVITSFESVLRRAGSKSTSLDFDLALEPLNVLIDVAQVETGLLNLVVNAYDATPPDGGIVVSTRAVELAADEVRKLPAGRYVALSVSDTGHGMHKDTADRAVEPFFTTKAVGKGTGLGLSQVYGMMQQSEGDLTIESKEGEGTRITLYFPVAGGGEAEQPSSDTETVLIVDDQAEVLDMTAELFRTLGFEVLTASSGEDALEVLQRTPRVDLLLSDVIMAGMSGVELAKQARQARPSLKIILVSGYTGGLFSTPVDGLLEGFQFLTKPYRVNDVVRKLRALG
jgi:CheY-like chemotaxis protein/two-component sensor histidine kinase